MEHPTTLAVVLEHAFINRIEKNSNLFKVLYTCLSKEDNPLDSLLDDSDCETIITKADSGQQIYAALIANKPISDRGLKILARHKERVIDHMNTLPEQEQRFALTQAFKNQYSLHKFFSVQRGFLQTRPGAGTFKMLATMQDMLNRAIEHPHQECCPAQSGPTRS